MIVAAQQYRNRAEAGQLLARHLAHYADRVDSLVLGVPRGGVPIAAEVAAYLHAPLDAFVVRKLSPPNHDETAIGAIASGGVRVLDHTAIDEAGVTRADLARATDREAAELARLENFYRGKRPPLHLAGRVVILVDDGLPSGFSMHAAVIAAHQQQPAWLVVAAPVGSVEACEDLAHEVHEVVCPLRAEPFDSIGLWYDHFAPVDDDEVRNCLRHAGGLARD